MKKLMIAIAALAMFAGSAVAADWNFYGNVRFYTFYSETDHQTAGVADTEGTTWRTSYWSRIGANVKVSDEVSGRFEWDIAGTTDGTDLRIRHLYGDWNFGAGVLRIGNTYAPTFIWGSGQVGISEDGLASAGEMGGGRTGQIQLRFDNFVLAFVQPSMSNQGATGAEEVKLPQISASYTFKGDGFNIKLAGGYQTYDLDDQDVTSYLLGIGGDVTFGGFTLYASVHGGENIGHLQNGNDTGAIDATPNYVAGNIVDCETIEYRLVGTYKFNDMVSFELGYGYAENEFDVAGSVSDEAQMYYANLPITLAPGVTVTPEIGVFDQDEDGQDKTTYFGANWRINF